MGTEFRILAVGGDRAVLVGLAHAFKRAGAVFAALADPSQLLESAARFAPNAILVFAHPSPEDAMRSVWRLRAAPRFANLPILLVASLPPRDTRGVTRIVPDPSDVADFATRLLQFLATLPAPVPPAEDEEAGEIQELAEVEEIPALSARILLVDDDPSLSRLFSIAMTKSGFDVRVASDGEEGLRVALEMRPDLIVADLNMPRLDGWGLLRAIRADHRIGETPLMFLSCHDDYRESLKALSAGAQDYVAKGGKLDALVARIRSLLAARDAFHLALAGGERLGAKIEELGVQWALRKMGAAGVTGAVQLRDPFWTCYLGLDEGQLHFARATIGQHVLEGPAALPPITSLRAGELLYVPKKVPESNLEGALGKLIEEAALKNNANEAAALDRLLTQATKVEVDEELYQLYEQLGPPASRDIARLVRQGLTPREVIASSSKSPTEVEETIRDLFRRKVVRLGV
ncbi:MAG: response regulator [Myxococcales bacterium]|jgi:DNA-binding response OmpR family regulator